jgi:hypothetical protein
VLGIIFLSIVSAGGIVCLGVFLFVSHRLTETEAYKDSITLAESSPEVQAAFGNNITVKWPAWGFNLPFPSSQFAQWSATRHPHVIPFRTQRIHPDPTRPLATLKMA